MNKSVILIPAISAGLFFGSCSNKGNSDKSAVDTGDTVKETFSIATLVDEVKTVPDSIIEYLHKQHHAYKVLERRTVPAGFETPNMKFWKSHVKEIGDLPVINPGPGEYVHVMEGHKCGYNNLVIGITETFPGGAPPMHTHEGEESHVLLEGEILYALGDTMFTVKAPYIVNIPPMVPHAFKNIGKKTANLVVIFPTNIWKYDVVDYFPFDKKAKDHSHTAEHRH
jgi:quercetin dioxygenase-like cupin family protein